MSSSRSTKEALGPRQNAAAKRSGGNGGSPSKGKAVLIIVVALAIIALVVAAAWANSSSRGLDIQKGDRLQYLVESYTAQGNTTGSLIIEVTETTSTSFEITYAITLENKTERRPVTFTGASGDWASNIANIMNKLSGSDSSATTTNETQLWTVYGARNAIGHTITTTTQSGVGLYYQYWLGTTDKCPLLLVLQYANGDAVTGSLVHTNIEEFQS